MGSKKEIIRYTSRGFADYGELTDTYNSTITVRQSSSAEGDRVWIFCDNKNPNHKNPQPHLNKQQILEPIEILQFAAEHMIEDNREIYND